MNIDLTSLRDDGDVLKLDDGRALRLRVVPDDYRAEDISEHGDVYGRTRWTRGNDYGPVRPHDFTGAAEILNRDGRDALWWEPYDPSDVPGGRDGEAFKRYRAMVRDVVEYGFSVALLELLDGEDAYHRPIVVDVASLGGIEPFPDDDYVAEIVGDLFSELNITE